MFRSALRTVRNTLAVLAIIAIVGAGFMAVPTQALAQTSTGVTSIDDTVKKIAAIADDAQKGVREFRDVVKEWGKLADEIRKELGEFTTMRQQMQALNAQNAAMLTASPPPVAANTRTVSTTCGHIEVLTDQANREIVQGDVAAVLCYKATATAIAQVSNPGATATPTSTSTPTNTPVASPTGTTAASPSATPTAAASATATGTPTNTPTAAAPTSATAKPPIGQQLHTGNITPDLIKAWCDDSPKSNCPDASRLKGFNDSNGRQVKGGLEILPPSTGSKCSMFTIPRGVKLSYNNSKGTRSHDGTTPLIGEEICAGQLTPLFP